MLGIYKVSKGMYFKRWITAWLTILGCVFGILTLQFLYCDFVADECGRDVPMKLRKRIKWWLVDWVTIFGELVVILTFGRFATTWGLSFYTWTAR